MAVSTVADSRKHASATAAKSKSEFSIRSWFFGARKSEQADDEPFAPDAQSQWAVEQVRAELRKAVSFLTKPKHAAASPTDLDGSHPAYLLRRIGMQALDLEIDPELTFRGAADRLRWAWDLLEQRAAEEAAVERHAPANKAEAAADGALLFANGQRGKPIGPDSDRGKVAVADIVDRAVKAPELTGQLPRITDGMRDPSAAEPEQPQVEITAVASHDVPGDIVPGVVRGIGAAPVPADLPHAEPLPKREPRNTGSGPTLWFPALLDETDDPIDGRLIDPHETQLAEGDWALDDSNGLRPAWGLVREVVVAEDGTAVEYASGLTVTVAKGRTVWMLTAVEAKEPLAAYEAAFERAGAL